MSKQRMPAAARGFPARRPEITITPSRAKPFAVDCRELPSWFLIPEIGERTTWVIYNPPDWRLTNLTDLRVVRPATIHGVDCVEIELRDDDWEEDEGWVHSEWTMYGRVAEDRVGWLATQKLVGDRRALYTFLDDDFDEDWGDDVRRMEDRGRYVTQKDGTYRTRRSKRSLSPEAVGAGMFRVTIGGRAFTCLRTIDCEYDSHPGTEHGVLFEAYITRKGRTVLGRRYNGRFWAVKSNAWGGPPWDERYPDNERLVIDGVTYVHWYDCLPSHAC